MFPPLHVPSSTGRAIVTELDRVPWEDLFGCCGRGHRTRAALTLLGDANPYAAEEATELFYSSVYHQGDIYQVTAYAVPYLAAFAAGDDVWRESSVLARLDGAPANASMGFDPIALVLMAIAESAVPPPPSDGDDDANRPPKKRLAFARDVRAAFVASAAHLARMAERVPKFAKAERVIAEVAAATTLTAELAERAEELSRW